MKRLFLLLCVLPATCIMLAQDNVDKFSIIPRVGLNLSNLTSNEVVTDMSSGIGTLSSRIKPGLVVGADIEYQAVERFFVSMGLHYSAEGFRFPDFEGSHSSDVVGYSDWHTNLNYLRVPFMAGYNLTNRFSLKTGVRLGLLLNAKEELMETSIVPLKGGGRQQSEATQYSRDLYSSCKKVDVSVPIALSYEYENVIVEACYNLGLSRVYKNNVVKSRGSVIEFSVGYRLCL